MKNRKSKNLKRVKSSSRQSKTGPSSSTFCNNITSVNFRTPSFYLDQASSGTGGFTSAGSPTSITAQNGIIIDPFQIGGQIYRFAALFLKYRLRRLRVRYIPFSAVSGVQSIVAGSTTAPSYASRPFSLGFIYDPGFGASNYLGLVISGGQECQTSKSTFIDMSGPNLGKWRYTSNTTGTAIDYRQMAASELKVYFADTSTTTTQRFGVFFFEGSADFQYQTDYSVPIGATLSIKSTEPESEEKKPEPTGLSLKDWELEH